MNSKTKLQLPDVTLVCADCKNIPEAIEAMEISLYYADFGDVKFLTSEETDYKYKVKIDPIRSYSDYSRFIFNNLNQYVTKTNFCNIIQHDGFWLNPNNWTDEFYDYDFTGSLLGPEELPEIVGNGGFCLRSKKLLDICANIGKMYNDKNIDFSEDLAIVFYFRAWLESQGIKFAPVNIAKKWGVERERKYDGTSVGFHNWFFVNPYKDGWKNPLGHEESIHNIDKYIKNLQLNQNG